MPTDYSTLDPEIPNKPESTVSEPVKTALAPEAQTKFQAVVDKIGYAPRTLEERDMFYRAAFTPEELKQYGLDQEYQTLAGQTANAQQALAATPAPTNSGLRVLQEALNAKSNVTNQELGTSKLFEAAGLSGYAVLRQSMAERAREMERKYGSFKNTVADTATAMTDVYNMTLDRYNVLKDELDKADQRMYELLDESLAYERQLDLMYKQHELDKEYQKYLSDLEDQYSDGGVSDGSYSDVVIDGEKITSPEIADIFGLGQEKGWCGVFASQISDAGAVGDSWASKLSNVDKRDMPTAGDKLLIPLGVKDGAGYGHVATVLSYNPMTGNIIVVESNKDGRQNRGEGLGVATLGSYSLPDLKTKYGSNFGFKSGNLKGQYKSAIPYANEKNGVSVGSLVKGSGIGTVLSSFSWGGGKGSTATDDSMSTEEYKRKLLEIEERDISSGAKEALRDLLKEEYGKTDEGEDKDEAPDIDYILEDEDILKTFAKTIGSKGYSSTAAKSFLKQGFKEKLKINITDSQASEIYNALKQYL